MAPSFRILLMGILFGLLLTKAEVISWFRIRDMFFFRSPDLYLIIGSAIATAMPAVYLIRKLGIRGLDGRIPEIPRKGLDRGKFPGGVLFGAGWFLAGTCPGPLYAQLGAGAWIALFTLAGALAGAAAFSAAGSRCRVENSGSTRAAPAAVDILASRRDLLAGVLPEIRP